MPYATVAMLYNEQVCIYRNHRCIYVTTGIYTACIMEALQIKGTTSSLVVVTPCLPGMYREYTKQ